MKLLIVNQFFHPDQSAVAQIASDLAEDLVAAGHEVTVVAARGRYLGGAPLSARESWRGVQVVRVGGTSFGKRTLAGRLADYGSFYLAALACVLRLPRFDVVLATSAPPFVATLGVLTKLAKGSPFVYWLQDVYPELAYAFGLLRRRSVTGWLLERVSRLTLRSAAAVVTLGDTMAKLVVAKGVAPERVHVIQNWADGAALRPFTGPSNRIRQEWGLRNKTVVLYSGNMGRGHDLGTLLDAARLLRHREDLAFVFVGEGAKRAQVASAVGELNSIQLRPYQPRELLRESLSAGDVHVVTQETSTLGLIEPSKFYGGLAVGRPILFIGPVEAEVARAILREGVGSVVAPGDVAGAVDALVDLAARAEALGVRAREVFEREYDRPHRTRAFTELLQSIVDRTAPAGR